jgi:hypothetical protein
MGFPAHAGSSGPAESLSPQDRFLIQKSEEAIHDGKQLDEWIRAQFSARALRLFPLDLKRVYQVPNRAEGFLDTVPINGQPRSVMGCVQTVEFGEVAGDDAGARLQDFVCREFLNRAHWTYPDGFPGGFGVEQSLYKTQAGDYGRFTGDLRKGCVDWRELGKQYAWVLLTVQIHDFVMKFGPVTKRLREAACVSPAPDFVHIEENPSEGYKLEVSVGYPFIEYAPIPNFFGFGPGKFGIAVKLFSFFLTTKNEVRVRMTFAAAPRAAKVFDFGKRIPDPIYGGAGLLSNLSLGLWKTDAFHDRMDTEMLTEHCRVHQALMEGLRPIWMSWYAGSAEKI